MFSTQNIENTSMSGKEIKIIPNGKKSECSQYNIMFWRTRPV
jgi:hypothetical protein